MPRRYPPEFRRKVLDLLKSGRTVAEVAAALDVTEQTIYNWRNQELIDTGQKPGVSSIESADLAAARRRIAELETELAIARRSTELLKPRDLPQSPTPAQCTRDADPDRVRERTLRTSTRSLKSNMTTPRNSGHIKVSGLAGAIQQVHVNFHCPTMTSMTVKPTAVTDLSAKQPIPHARRVA